MVSTQEAQASASRSLPTKAARFALRLLIKVVVLFALLIWRFKPVMALLIVAAGIWFWLGDGVTLPISLPWQQQAAVPATFERVSEPVTSMAPVPPAAEQYLWGQSHFDADTVWNTLSDDMKRASARSGGTTLQRLRQQLDDDRRAGLQYDVRYVGGHLATDGNSFYLYVVGVSNGSNTRFIPYTFTINKEGKIVNID